MSQNATNVREKTHVEHHIGFVDDQHVQPGKINGPPADMIQQPAGAGHHDIRTFEILDLGIDPHAAIHHGAAQACLAAQDLEFAMNLFGQFTGGSDDQCTDPIAWAIDQPVENGQYKSGRFTRAGLGQPHYIASLHDLGNAFGLNGCGRGITRLHCPLGNSGVK